MQANSNMQNPELSIIIPVFNEEGNLLELYRRLINVLENELQVSYEIIFVDDGSNDCSWNIIEDLHKENKNVKGIKFSRNFGHDLAIKSGIDNCKGEIAICMDSDLQHPPQMIPKIYKSISKENYDIIFMKRISNEDENLFRKISNKFYYLLFKKFTGINISRGLSDFFAINKKVTEVLKQFTEKNYFNRGILLSIGFKNKLLEYKAEKRFSGESKYNVKDTLNLSIKSFVNFSAFPLKIVVYLGLFFSFLSFTYGIYSVIKTLLIGSISGWASLIITISFLNGFIILILSTFFEYFIVAFEELKNRPEYIIDRELK